MPFTVCPFCGIASEVPHDTQQTCIDALQVEISRTRQVLTQVSAPLIRPLPDPDRETKEDRQPT